MRTIVLQLTAIMALSILSINQLTAQNMKTEITEVAQKNHDEFFPDYVSKVKEYDPEFIALYDNFAFDDVASHGNLETKTKVMMILASTIASQSLTEYKMMLEAAMNVGLTPIEIKEIVYQAVPYVGISKVIDFLYATNEFLLRKGGKLPLEGQATTTRETRFQKGLATQTEIFGDRIGTMHRNAPKNQVHIQQYLSANCFGDYITRNGLDVKTRELLTFSMLLSLGGCESQLKGHIQGNVNVGNDKEVLLDVVTQLIPYVGYPRALNAIACLNEIIPENK